MRLRTRLALGLASISLFAAAGLSITATRAIDRSYADEHARAVTDTSETLARNRATRERYLKGMLAGVDETLAVRNGADGAPLLKSAADGDPEAERVLIETLQEQAAQRQLDVLDLVRADGRVLASAHFPRSSLSRSDPAAPKRVDQTGVAIVQTPAADGSPLNPDGSVASRAALVTTRALDALPDLFLVGGIFLDDPHQLRALAGDPDSISLEIPGRPPVVATRELASSTSATPAVTSEAPQELVLEETVPVLPSFDAPDEARAATVRIARVDRAADVRGKILRGFLVIATVLVLFSLLFASILARRFAAPIDALSIGAREVAAGNLDVKIPTPDGGPKDELVELVEAFNAMSKDLKDSRAKILQTERIAAWREIAQRIAHEIKNPLTPIQLAVETTRRARRANRADFDEIFEESATAILEEVESLKKLVKEFSEFARMPEPVLAPDDVNEAVKHALKVFTGLPEGVKLETRLAEGLPKVALDREQLSRALLNLVANAADAVGPAGTIVVRTHPAADERGPGVEIHVTDDGPGVPPEAREKIFTPYFTTKSNGTGLGLAIVQRIVTDHGGEITVRPADPRGADFVVRLKAA